MVEFNCFGVGVFNVEEFDFVILEVEVLDFCFFYCEVSGFGGFVSGVGVGGV